MVKYERITADLRRKIHAGELPVGERLPSQDQLALDYRVSLPTIRQALGVLEDEGMIDSVQGVGTYVRAPRRRVRRDPTRYQWEKDRARLSEAERGETGATEHDTGLGLDDLEFSAEYDTIPAGRDLAAAFGVPLGTKILHRSYRTDIRAEGAALYRSESYLVYDVAAANPDLLDDGKEPWPGGTIHQMATIGIEVDRIQDEITARPPTAAEAEEMSIGPGVAVLVLRKTLIDTTGRVVEVADVVMPGDRQVMAYCTQLERWES